jgi:peptidoglycan/xylan/chitin deacetylase (PgdA/CDA1 family)
MAGSLVLKLLVLLALGGSRLATANRDLHPPLAARNPPVPNLPMPQSVSKTPGSIINTCTKPGVVALAYDDGPGIYTDQLLDILRQNSIQVTFFVNGNNEDGPITEGTLPKTLKNTLLQGHQIGSHTWSHADLNSLTREERWEEMESLQEALANVTGFAPTYMRPPYFSCTDDCVQDMTDFGFRVVRLA